MFSSENLSAILAALPDLVFVLTRSGLYAEVFGGMDLRYYHDARGLVGRQIAEVVPPEKAGWFLAQVARALDEGGMHIVEYSLSTADVRGLEAQGPAEPLWFEGRIQRLGFQVQGEDAVLWVASNVTERHALEARLRAQSETDALTGLWNRRCFEKRVRQEMHRALRYAHPVSLLIFDIDHFKVVNDTCGHQAGDEVLVEVARLVEGCIRESDSLTRWGGEEFTVLMADTALETAGLAAEKLRSAVAAHRFSHGLRITVSIGVAEWAGEDESLHGLVSRADEALYTAKHTGRNRSVLARADAAPGLPLMTDGLPLSLHWRAHYESGHAQIDAEHRTLFDMAAALMRAVAEAGAEAGAGLVSRMDDLLAHIGAHFSAEERILAEQGWAGLDAHRAEHRDLLARAAQLRSLLQAGSALGTLQDLVRFVAIEVVANHVLRVDREFHPLLSPREAPLSPLAGSAQPGPA
ncbi:diguanylate cyclase [Uliginosibacterium paludis]|uniref:diguanylate cyclase n=1 Tax=Uliginosibacterium paludis TaxID=1615952 RepID=A0ABV2CR20_9RHOO